MHDERSQSHTHDHGHSHSGENTILHELLCHLPYAIYSVAFSLIILSIYSVFSMGLDPAIIKKGSKALFHSFHFMHIVFFFLFYAVLPYIVCTLLGVDMHFHMCFLKEPQRVIPFLIVGVINGFVMSMHHESKQGGYSLSSHATHITISSLASTFYLISH